MKRLAGWIRWIARLLGAVFLIILVKETVSKDVLNPMQWAPEEQIRYLALLIILIGIVGAWVSDIAGGFLILLGTAIYWYLQGMLPQGYLAAAPLAGCLFLIVWLLDHRPGEPAPAIKQFNRPKGKARGKKR